MVKNSKQKSEANCNIVALELLKKGINNNKALEKELINLNMQYKKKNLSLYYIKAQELLELEDYYSKK